MQSTLRVKIQKTFHVLLSSAGLTALALLAGCQNRDQKALEQAKAQAVKTHIPQQVQYVDDSGETVTKTVEPPAAKGEQPAVTTLIMPPPPGSKPHSTPPVITPLPSAAQGAPYGEGPGPSGPPAPNGYPGPSGPTEPNGYPGPGQSMQPEPMATGAPPTMATGAPPTTANAPYGEKPAISLRVPAGSWLTMRIDQRISVRSSYDGERFNGNLVEPVVINGSVVIPRGTPVRGQVEEVHRGGHFRGRSILELRLTAMMLSGYEYPIHTYDAVRTAHGKGKRSAGFIGGLTGAGMLIGGLAGGGLGLAVGAAAGAGGGTAIAGATDNHILDIPAESVVHFRLADPIVLQN